MSEKWYQKSYRRLLFDMHIDDWDEHFLSHFDPAKFVETVRTAHITALTVPANNQSWTFCGDWLFGASDDLARESDFLSCDLYADRYPLSLYSKLFRTLSEKLPFEHLNGWYDPNIHEHVVQRSAARMRIIAFSDIMNNGAAAPLVRTLPSISVWTRCLILRKTDEPSPLHSIILTRAALQAVPRHTELARNLRATGFATMAQRIRRGRATARPLSHPYGRPMMQTRGTPTPDGAVQMPQPAGATSNQLPMGETLYVP